MVDVYGLKATGAYVLKSMGNAGRPEHNFTSRCFQDRISNEKACSADQDDEGLVIRMNVEARSGTRSVSAIRQHGDRAA